MTEAAVSYEGVVTEADSAEIERLCQTVHPAIAMALWRIAKSRIAEPAKHHVGRISEDALETRIGSVEARIPWGIAIGYVESRDVIVLLVGRGCLPITRGLFSDEEQWQFARQTVMTRVRRLPTSEPPSASWRTVILWLSLLIVVYLAWHFARFPGSR